MNSHCKRKLLLTLSIALLLALCMVGTLNAQSATGQITGSVTDPSGSVIPNVKISLTNQRTGATRETMANDSGAYAFPLLPVGVYSVSAEQQGFSVAKRSDITL